MENSAFLSTSPPATPSIGGCNGSSLLAGPLSVVLYSESQHSAASELGGPALPVTITIQLNKHGDEGLEVKKMLKALTKLPCEFQGRSESDIAYLLLKPAVTRHFERLNAKAKQTKVPRQGDR